MHIRWRGLELPSRVTRDEEHSTDSYGLFTIEPFEHGFGTTVGNSLRRILLSSLEGAAVSSVKIVGVAHEFTSLDGVLEDVTDIVLNLKGLVLRLDDDAPRLAKLDCDKVGEVRAGDIEAEAGLEVLNPDHLIATLTAPVRLQMEMTVTLGRGYVPSHEGLSSDPEIGVIPVDAIYSPILRVRYKTEDMRVGQRTNYDRLIMEVWAKGTILPEDALVEAATILRKHLNPFIRYSEIGEDWATPLDPVSIPTAETDSGRDELLGKPVAALGLSVRALNCLEAAQVSTIGGLVARTEQDLLRFRSFGKTSLHEVQRKLSEMGLGLGSRLDSEGRITTAPPLVTDIGLTTPVLPDAPGVEAAFGGETASGGDADAGGEDTTPKQEVSPSGSQADSADGPQEALSMND